MTTQLNAAPLSNLRGIKDESGRTPSIQRAATPAHLPLIHLFTQKGPTDGRVVIGDSAVRLYGVDSFDERSKYATPNTVLFNTVTGNANQVMVQRLKPTDALPPATIVLWADVLLCPVREYARHETGANQGQVVYDANGQPTYTGSNVDGAIIKWVAEAAPRVNSDGDVITPSMAGDEAFPVANAPLASLAPKAGDQEYDDGDTVQISSTRYPILAFAVPHFGSDGNNQGLTIYAPNLASTEPVDADAVEAMGALILRVLFKERNTVAQTSSIVRTNLGTAYTEVTLKEGTVNPRTDRTYGIEEVLLDSYQQLNIPGLPDKFGPFGAMHSYSNHVETIGQALYALEEDAYTGLVPAYTDGAEYLLNIFTGRLLDNNRYAAIRVVSPTMAQDSPNHDPGNDVAILLSENAVHYAVGGGDGTISLASWDALVRNEMENFGDLETPYLNRLKYPVSAIWDVGFTMPTKRALFTAIGRRKDVWVCATTQDVVTNQIQNTAEEEYSAAVALRTYARAYPESELYGTDTCRAVIHGHSGWLINSRYKGLLPLTIEYAAKVSAMQGATNGQWNQSASYTMPPNNRVTMFRDVNCTYKPAEANAMAWANGLVYVVDYDMYSQFVPAYQTVYDDDTSVLNSAVTMQACVEIEKVCDRVWADMVGIDELTTDQLIERSDDLIRANTTPAKFGGRFVIEPETHLTPNDENDGYSWSCNVTIYANNMRTVANYTIVARRMDDLE